MEDAQDVPCAPAEVPLRRGHAPPDPPRPIQMLEVHSPLLELFGSLTPSSTEVASGTSEIELSEATALSSDVAGETVEDVPASVPSTQDQTVQDSVTSGKPSLPNRKAKRQAKPKAKPSHTQSLCQPPAPRSPRGRAMSPSAPSIIMANTRETKTWMHMDEFCKTFSRLHLFYSTSALRHQCVLSDLAPAAAPATVGTGRDKEKGTGGKSRMSTNSRHSDSEHSLRRVDHTEPLYLFLDSLESSVIYLNLHTAPPEPPPEPTTPEPPIGTDESLSPTDHSVRTGRSAVTQSGDSAPGADPSVLASGDTWPGCW
ncbi:uncharacterized protein LOC119092261 [Pollicipes pollicipes]|uniref:uncharacterized protein LOC119092261 n=1 Tax=Pollicipes pollicipes TaxID=41117 RepID=UPI001885385F|nr:uncharacterized protein LOC119092261 [Pollicipes pollicipes]